MHTVSLMALGSGIWEYFDIKDKEDLKEAYKDFDNRVAFGGDIELQYIDGSLSGYSCSVFNEVMDLLEEYNEDIDIISNIVNATCNIEETKRILNNKNFGFYHGSTESEAFRDYLIETDFFYDIPEDKHTYIDIEKVKRDYYFIDIHPSDELEKYLFIFN